MAGKKVNGGEIEEILNDLLKKEKFLKNLKEKIQKIYHNLAAELNPEGNPIFTLSPHKTREEEIKEMIEYISLFVEYLLFDNECLKGEIQDLIDEVEECHKRIEELEKRKREE